jgi:hypothetical protein
MKQLMLSLLSLLCIHQSVISHELDNSIGKAEDITYDWLVHYGDVSAVTNHIPHFKKIFKLLKVKNFLEFGMGFSTKYFLDNCNKVISVEFITDGCGPEWIKKYLDLYKNYSNWIPIGYFSAYQGDTNWVKAKYLASEALAKAGYYQTVNHKNYALINDFYLVELNSFIVNLLKSHKVDVAFADPGTSLRGDVVQLLFNKVPVIAAHNTHCRHIGQKDDVFGYSRIITPENYEEIYISDGFTVWVIKNEKFTTFIEQLKKYAEGI